MTNIWVFFIISNFNKKTVVEIENLATFAFVYLGVYVCFSTCTIMYVSVQLHASLCKFRCAFEHVLLFYFVQTILHMYAALTNLYHVIHWFVVSQGLFLLVVVVNCFSFFLYFFFFLFLKKKSILLNNRYVQGLLVLFRGMANVVLI